MKTFNVVVGLSCLFLSFACAQPKHAETLPVSYKADSEIKFRFAESDVLSKYESVLEDDVTYLKNNPTKAVVIEGNTDVLGENEYNLDLGDQRAKAVKAYFIEKGIEASRIITITYGEEQPKKDANTTRENRRVVIRDMNK
ncbi:MAG: OmpA family protein [bacterium]